MNKSEEDKDDHEEFNESDFLGYEDKDEVRKEKISDLKKGMGQIDETENTCYECGSPISAYSHFCEGGECSKKYRKRFKSTKEMKDAIARTTKLRKKHSLPRFE
jgi:hypothetical protein